MHRLMPDFILARYAAGQMSGEFQAAGMFVDVSGFSAMTDQLMQHGQHGAEVLAAVMRDTFAPLIQSVFEQSGFVAVQAGDAFTAIFSLGKDPVQSTRRALAAAWNIQQRAAARPLHVTPYGDFPISVKVGISLGEVGWGILQSESGAQATYYFRGGAIDSSAQAEHHASGGQIILDVDFHDQVKEQVRAEAKDGFFLLTGMREYLPAPLPVTAPEQDAKLVSRFFPAEVYSQRQMGEFRQVVYLFISMEETEGEGRLYDFVQRVFGLQAKYGGLFSVHFGDKGAHLLLIWGAPVAHENDVQRALNFVLDLHGQTEGKLKAGMTYRIAHAGFIGSELAAQYAAFGRGANLAARFMEAAPAQSIWVDEYIAERAKRLFQLEYVGCLDFKGFAVPHEVYALRGHQESNERFFSGALIGREQELGRLADFVQPIFEGGFPGMIVVRGEPGMGKSRLVFEYLQGLAQVSGGGFLECLAQTDEILREGLNPFAYWLRHYFGLTASAGESANKDRFDQRLDTLVRETSNASLGSELNRTRSCLGALLGLRWPDSLYEQLDAQGRYENTLISLITLLQLECLRQPVVIVLEDAQWLDTASSELLTRLDRTLMADAKAQYPLAIITTTRIVEKNEALARLAKAEIELSTLERAGLASLAETRLGGRVSESLSLLLEVHSEGNPFFAEQILRYLQERRLVVADAEGWDISSEYNRSPLPLEVSAVLIARLDRLAEDVKEAVQTAAVLGREFEVRLLSHMLRTSAPALFDSEEGERIGRVVSLAEQEAIWSALDELRYIFRHALLRETAYQMQVQARRQELHAVALQALEAVYRDEIALHYAELAYHADHAALTDKARTYYRKAGDAAAEVFQNDRAIEDYSRALELTPSDDRVSRYDLLVQREQIFAVTGDHETRQLDLDELDALTRPFDDEARMAHVALRRARYAWDGGDYPATIELAGQSIELARPLKLWEIALPAYGLVANALYRFGQSARAREEAEQGLRLAEKYGSPLDQSVLFNHLGVAHYEQGHAELAKENFEKSLELAEETGDLRAQTMPLSNLAMVAGALGDFPAAQRIYEDSLAVWRKIGLRWNEEIDLANLGWVAGNMGEYGKAREYLERQLRIAREMGDLNGETYGSINLSGPLAALGDNLAASRVAEDALALARKTGDHSAQAWALTYLGHSQLALGQHEAAAGSYRHALEIRRELGQPVLAAEPLAGLARTALAVGDITSAQAHTEEILAFLEDSGSLDGTDDPLRVYFACHLVLASTEDPRAWPLLQTAHAQLTERAGRIENPEAKQRFLANVEINRLIGEAWENRQRIE